MNRSEKDDRIGVIRTDCFHIDKIHQQNVKRYVGYIIHYSRRERGIDRYFEKENIDILDTISWIQRGKCC